jgi:integrase
MGDGYDKGLKLGTKGTYIYRIKVAGRVRTGDTSMTRLFEAERELVKIRASFLQSSMGIEGKKPLTFKKAVEEWAKKKAGIVDGDYIQNTVRHMEIHFIPYIGDKYINKISIGDFQDCLTRYAITQNSNKDIERFGGYNKMIMLLTSIMNYMISEHYIAYFEMPKTKKSQEVIYDVLNLDEINRFIEHIEKKQGLTKAVATAMGCFMGLRSSEIANAKWHNINWETLKFQNDRTKGRESQKIKINEYLLPWLLKLKGGEEKIGHLLLDETGMPVKRRFLSDTLEREGHRLFKKHITPHSLRRSFITWLHSQGVAPKTWMKLARHTTLAMTMRYIQVDQDDMDKAMDHAFHRKSS